jgi:RND family efflux transporter MFP subunit
MKRLVSASLISLLALLAAGCHDAQPAQTAAPASVSAHVVDVRQEQAPVNLNATGTVHARDTAVISAQVMGRIEQVLVREGDAVRAGQTLAVLDSAALRAGADQAQAAALAAQNQQTAAESGASLAASTLARYKQLEAEKSVSPQEMDEVTRRSEAAAAQLAAARAQADAARAQASGARTMLAYAHIVAPFAGIVTSRMADPGTMAAPGVPLLQIDRSGPLQLQTTVDESAFSAVRNGMKVPVTISGIGAPLTGVVAEIVPAADPASHSFTVKIDLPATAQLHAGMYGSASFSSGMHQAVLAPSSAIVQRGSLAYAYALDKQGIAQLRYVTLGPVHGNQVEILSGLAAGERVVDTPADRDLAGRRIEVQP